MFFKKKWFSLAKASREEERLAPANTLIWAVGDVHGQLALLNRLSAAIVADMRQSPCDQKILIFLGDYIDRGVEARGVIDHISRLASEPPLENLQVVCLKGNHEELMLMFLDEPAIGANWCLVGGTETLISYGVTPPPPAASEQNWQDTSAELREKLPIDHLRFLENLRISFTIGDFHFVHAGVRPGVAIEDQQARDALWIRDVFLKDKSTFPKMIVHGHSPECEPFMDHRRICIDTGSYATGMLSALRLEGAKRVLMHTQRVRGRVQLALRPMERSASL